MILDKWNMTPHLVMVNGKWTIANEKYCSTHKYAAALFWCAARNMK